MRPVAKPVRQNYEFGSFRLALLDRRLTRNGEAVLLPPKEIDLLLLLVQNQGEVMSRETLIKALWPMTAVIDPEVAPDDSADSPDLDHYLEDRAGHPNTASAVRADRLEDGGSDWYSRHRLAAVTLPLWALAIALIGILAVLYFKTAKPTPAAVAGETAMNVVPLTTYAGRESDPAFSPDGNQIAFVWDGEKGDNTDVYVRLVDGGNWVRLTTNPGDDVNPVWSPDSRTIAFYRSAPEGDGIFLTPALGGAERKLSDAWANRFGFGPHSWLDWSSDGKWLVVSD